MSGFLHALPRPALIALAIALSVRSALAADMLDLAVADVLARPGDRVELVAKLEKKAPRGVNVPAAAIEFRLDGHTVGRADTDERGVARLKLTAPGAGDHVVKAVHGGTKDLLRAEYNALLTVRRSEDPILVVDLDWTLAMTDDLNTTAGGVDCPPLVGAPEAMASLARSHTVIYLTGRARQLRKRTISWLFRYGFPRGPSYYLDPTDYPTYDVVAFKAAVLKGLASGFSGLKFGIGNDAEDADAYRTAGLRTVLVGKAAIAGVSCVPTWADVEKAVRAPAPPVAPSPRGP